MRWDQCYEMLVFIHDQHWFCIILWPLPSGISNTFSSSFSPFTTTVKWFRVESTATQLCVHVIGRMGVVLVVLTWTCLSTWLNQIHNTHNMIWFLTDSLNVELPSSWTFMKSVIQASPELRRSWKKWVLVRWADGGNADEQIVNWVLGFRYSD